MIDVHLRDAAGVGEENPRGGARPEAAAGGLSSAEREGLQRLRIEVRELEQTNEILQLASSFFTRKFDPQHH